MATEPKRPDDKDNIVSLREARARQAAQARSRSQGSKSDGGRPEKRMPVLLIFLGLLAVLVAYKLLLG
jgi:type VI protein secretion system component VasF